MRKCFLYCRISSELQASGDGLDRQEARLNAYIQNKGVSLGLDCNNYELIVDSGKSAFKGHHLASDSGLGKLFARVEAGLIDGTALICESLDRFSRQNPFKAMKYLSLLADHDIELHDVEQNLVIGKANKMSLTMATIIAQRAYDESTLKSVRIKSGWNKRRDKAKASGQYMIKNTPPWIDIQDDKYVLNSKAEIVREVFDLYLNGIGSYTIGKTLNEQGKLLTDVKWTTAKICKLLRNCRAKGDYLSNSLDRNFDKDTEEVNSIVIENLYPAIVTEAEFEQVQRNLKNHNYVGRIRDNKKQTVFGGMFKCSLCGAALPVKINGKYRYAKCIAATEQHGCEGVNLNYTVLEKTILSHVKKVDFERVYKSTDVSELDTVRGMLSDTQKNIDEFAEGLKKIKTAGRIPSFDMLDTKAQLEEKLVALKSQLQQLENSESIKNITLSDSIYDISNVAERSRLELELRKVIKEIKIKAVGEHYVVDIIYHSDFIQHMLIIDRKGGIVSFTSLSNEWIFDSAFLTKNLLTGEQTVHRVPNQIDYEVLKYWESALEKVEEIISIKGA